MTVPGGRVLYLSKRKLDEDFARVRWPTWRRVAGTAIRLLGFVTVTLPYAQIKVDVPKEDQTDIEKLDAVWKDLIRRNLLGTVDEPKEYFHGRCVMRYQAFREINPPILYLTGQTQETLLALGGALKHAQLSIVATPPDNAQLAMFETDVVRTLAQFQGVTATERRPDDQWTSDVIEIYLYSSGNEIECEFLAEKERWKQDVPFESGTKNVLLGSPLFVTYRFSG